MMGLKLVDAKGGLEGPWEHHLLCSTALALRDLGKSAGVMCSPWWGDTRCWWVHLAMETWAWSGGGGL